MRSGSSIPPKLTEPLLEVSRDMIGMPLRAASSSVSRTNPAGMNGRTSLLAASARPAKMGLAIVGQRQKKVTPSSRHKIDRPPPFLQRLLTRPRANACRVAVPLSVPVVLIHAQQS